jgi:hypothetical protein
MYLATLFKFKISLYTQDVWQNSSYHRYTVNLRRHPPSSLLSLRSKLFLSHTLSDWRAKQRHKNPLVPYQLKKGPPQYQTLDLAFGRL